MKKLLFIIPALCLATAAICQQPVFINNPYPKTITVNGSAMLEVIPDQIHVNIELREYQKKGELKKDIEAIKTGFLEACKRAGIPDSAISIVSYSGYNNYYAIRKKKKNTDLSASITYQVIFSSSRLMDNLVEQLDDEATQNFSIVSVSHSQITAFREQLKIKAIQAAKNKGVYLTEAIGEKLGEAVTINEPAEWQPFAGMENAYLSNVSFAAPKEEISKEIDFKKIKLQFDVTVVFALK